MALSIRNHQVEQAARELSKRTGETLTEAILIALRERLERVTGRRRPISLAEQLDEIAKRCAGLPLLDSRSDDEILGYDPNGIPRQPPI
jgi:antitoxin VapB